MGNDGVENQGRRRFLTATTAVVGAVGAGFVAVPFIKSWNPSAKAKLAGAPITADISALAEGTRMSPWWWVGIAGLGLAAIWVAALLR